MSEQINVRLRALKLRPKVNYQPANPRDGSDERKKRYPSIGDVEHANILWAHQTFNFDAVDGIHVAELQPVTSAAQAGFFSGAAVPMRIDINRPISIAGPGAQKFTMPVYVVSARKWYKHNFNPAVMSTTRFPAFDPTTKELSVNPHRRAGGCSPVEIVEVYVAVLWQTLQDILTNRSSTDTAVLVVRSVLIYLQEFANVDRITTNEGKARNAARLRSLLEKRDESTHDAAALTTYISTLHPTDYYSAMFQNFDFFDSRSMPAIFHLFMGLITGPDNVSIYGLREIVLQACIERCARHIGSVRLTGASLHDLDACYRKLVERAATVLVPILRTWSFVLDCLTLFCAPAFLTTQAAHVAKQIGAYADYATTYVKDGDLRGAMKAIYPGVARMSNEDIVEMLMRAGECSRKTQSQFNATELFQGVDGTPTKFDTLHKKAKGYDQAVCAAVVTLVAQMQTQGDTATIPLGGLPHFFSGKFAVDSTTLALDYFARRGDREMYDLILAKTPSECRTSRRFRAIWNFYHDGKSKDSTQMNPLVLRLSRHIGDDCVRVPGKPHVSLSHEDEEEKKVEAPANWSSLLDPQHDRDQRIKAREVLVMNHECCVCFEDKCTLVTCCIVSSKHQVCTTCLPAILAGRVCPLCRGDVN